MEISTQGRKNARRGSVVEALLGLALTLVGGLELAPIKSGALAYQYHHLGDENTHFCLLFSLLNSDPFFIPLSVFFRYI